MSRHKDSLGRARGFGATLWWADPPSTLIAQLNQQARRQVCGSCATIPCSTDRAVFNAQLMYRRVSVVLSKLLRDYQIFVEGETDVEVEPR